MTQATMMETAATPTEAASPSTAPESVAATADKLYGNTQKAPATQDRQAADAAPAGYASEWTGVAYQQISAGNTAGIVFKLGIVQSFIACHR